MGQQFYLDENDLNGQFERLNANLYEMMEFAYIHEDMVNTIEELVNEWAKDNLTLEYQKLIVYWDEMSEDEKTSYSDVEDFIQMDCTRWWVDSFPGLEVELKKKFIERFRLTVGVCMSSSTYDYDTIKGNIEKYWVDYQ
jgi:diphthamide synthase subunit DPH2